MQSVEHHVAFKPHEPAPLTFNAADQLEAARALIEVRFSDAGGQLIEALDIVGRLIESLDRLGVALDADSVARTTRDLLSTADSLNALPKAQAGRVSRFCRLQGASAVLRRHIDDMRQPLRYLRALALNVKITAGATTSSWNEFAGFAESMCVQIDVAGVQLDEFAAQLDLLAIQLGAALEFERGLDGQYQILLPAVPSRLAVDAAAIDAHHARVAEVGASVADIARVIQMKVAQALTALQIGDITRQRIEHVQFGLDEVARASLQAGLAPGAQARLERRVLHLLADQMADTASDFEREAAKVTENLAGMAGDTSRIMIFQTLTAANGDGGGLRDLEASLGQAENLVGDVRAAMANAQRIGNDTASAVEDLMCKVGAIHDVKRDIQYMAINSSLRCRRLGEIGKPLNVIALELAAHADQLEAVADQTLGALNTLADAATGAETEGAGAAQDEPDAERLTAASGRLRQAADVVERDLVGLTSQGEAAVISLSQAARQLNLKEGLGDALHTVAIALAEAAGPVVDEVDDIADVLAGALGAISARYTMARERTIHAGHAPAGDSEGEGEPGASAVVATEDEDDGLF